MIVSPDEHWADVYDTVSRPQSLAGLVAALSSLVWAHRTEIAEYLETTGTRRVHDAVRNLVAGWADRAVDGTVPDDVWQAVIDAADYVNPYVVARAALVAVTERADSRAAVIAGLQAQGTVEVGDGTWVPYPNASLHELFPGLAPDPRRQDRHWSAQWTATGVLAAVPHDVEVVYDFRWCAALDDALAGAPRSAAVLPSDGTVEYSTDHWTDDTFFGHRPVDDTPVWATAAGLLERAVEHDVAVAVLPEMCFGPDLDLDAYVAQAVTPPLTVAGSRHVVDGAGQHNEAVLYVNGHVALRHRKTQPFTARVEMPGDRTAWAERGGTGTFLPPERTEDLTPSRRVTVLFSDRWAVTVLVCSDVNAPHNIEVLTSFRVNMVLVPAMTPKHGYFETTFAYVAQRSQGLCTFANDSRHAPAAGQVPSTMFAFPAATGSVTASHENAPVLVVWESPGTATTVGL